MKLFALIVAAGKGVRMGTGDIPKQFLLLKNKPVLMHTIEKFHSFNPKINIILVLTTSYISFWENLCRKYNFDVPHTIVEGGAERFFSVKNGLNKVPDNAIVAIHDGVRPLVSFDTLQRCFSIAEKYGNAVPAIKCNDSVREILEEDNKIFDRNKIRLVQTPQTFDSELVKAAYSQPFSETFTDDASVLEAYGKKIVLVEGNSENIKITTKADLKMAEAIIL
ncbi:MAG: 2-C-methyl-D-erythritol 4-phosphate cytidylyltransferase [Prevotellaceae bacterium]|jgi:2-C-methyl-D-erythritol 4-phosphate cytidylyltransferase|nr:2-C-methyl-D-erythritol 4-phosphate cytidylyltransferase [Prevotellaceae bacterium]